MVITEDAWLRIISYNIMISLKFSFTACQEYRIGNYLLEVIKTKLVFALRTHLNNLGAFLLAIIACFFSRKQSSSGAKLSSQLGKYVGLERQIILTMNQYKRHWPGIEQLERKKRTM